VELAAMQLYRAKWTDQIHEEWIGSLLKNRTDLTREQLNRTRTLMNEHVPDCLITGYEALIPSIQCSDPDDRHVIAAAVKGRCSAIITYNLRHFPEQELERYDIEAQHPDEFINHQFGLDHASVLIAAQRCRARLKHPPLTASEYLRKLAEQELPKTVDELSNYETVL
jgi:predicted nucleic acid-binding protein